MDGLVEAVHGGEAGAFVDGGSVGFGAGDVVAGGPFLADADDVGAVAGLADGGGHDAVGAGDGGAESGEGAADAADGTLDAEGSVSGAGAVVVGPWVGVSPALDGVAVDVGVDVGDAPAGTEVIVVAALHGVDGEAVVRGGAGEGDGPAHFADVEVIEGRVEEAFAVGEEDVAVAIEEAVAVHVPGGHGDGGGEGAVEG